MSNKWSKNINNETTWFHNTEQILLFLRILLFRNISDKEHNIEYFFKKYNNILDTHRKNLIESNTIIIEISSLKIFKNQYNKIITWAEYNKTNNNKFDIISKSEFIDDLNNITNI